jgi:ACS family sodium-dependent inorganic phosphate cotransporter
MVSTFARWPRRFTVVGLCVCAVFICYIDRVNISVAIIPMAKRFGWQPETQGLVLSSFFIGYLLTQIVGGRLADRYGGKIVLGFGVLAWSLFTILTPPAAALGLGALLACRVAMGIGEAVTFPSFYSLYSRWVPLRERSRAIALSNSGIPLGTVSALLVTPFLVDHFGWQWAFYSFGLVGLLWYLVWARKVISDPARDPGISAEELRHIQAGTLTSAPTPPPPFRQLLARGPVWAIIVCHFCNNWSLYVLLSWLPTFVTDGLHVDFASVGLFTMLPHLSSLIALNVAGTVADRLIQRGVDVTLVRKTMQTLGFGGIATALLIVGHVQSAYAAIAIMCAGNFVGAFVTGGFAVNHMDVAPRYAGTLMGITNTAGTIPGIIGVYITGLILQATHSWALVFDVTAGVTLFGLVFYLIFGSGKRIFD